MEENKIKFDTISINDRLALPVITSVGIGILGILVALVFQDCYMVSLCVPESFFILGILSLISVAISIYFVKKLPIIVGMWIITGSIIVIRLYTTVGSRSVFDAFRPILLLPSFVMLFFIGAQVINKNWSNVEINNRFIQLTIGLLLSICALFLVFYWYK